MTTDHMIRVLLLTLALAMAAVPVGAAADPSSVVDDIRRQTAEVRGLGPIADIPLEIVDEATLGRVLADEPSGDPNRRERLTRQKLLAALGLIPADLDLDTLLADLVGNGVAGFYSREQKKLFVTGEAALLDGPEKVTIAHELTHALQDQHFDLERLIPAGLERADRAAAAQAVVEADAMLTMRLWGRRFLSPADKLSMGSADGAASGSRLEQAPLVLREALLFPYEEGAAFVQALYRRGGFKAIDEALREPPRTTEQIIHPEKYQLGELPRPAPLPDLADALGGDWRTLGRGVLGERDLRVLIEQFANGADAAVAAAGWDGDSYVVLEDEDNRLLVAIHTVWDTEQDAVEFYNAYDKTVARRFGEDQRRTLDVPSLSRWATPTGRIHLIKTGEQVILILAPDAETLEIAADQFE